MAYALLPKLCELLRRGSARLSMGRTLSYLHSSSAFATGVLSLVRAAGTSSQLMNTTLGEIEQDRSLHEALSVQSQALKTTIPSLAPSLLALVARMLICVMFLPRPRLPLLPGLAGQGQGSCPPEGSSLWPPPPSSSGSASWRRPGAP